MIQANIVLTQTFIDEAKLSKLIAYSFFESGLILPKSYDLNIENLEDSWIKYLSSNQIKEAEFADKEDFKDTVMSFYQNYEVPTLLFLGNLSKYSTALQEGMLRLLEEPPENLYIILFAHAKNTILPTIASRSRFLVLPKDYTLQNLDLELLEKVKKKLPGVGEFAKTLLSQNGQFEMPDLAKVERDELDFWLWQLNCYLEQYYTSRPTLQIANIIEKILQAQSLNEDNLQKKFTLGWIKAT